MLPFAAMGKCGASTLLTNKEKFPSGLFFCIGLWPNGWGGLLEILGPLFGVCMGLAHNE
jgi:hypothetical protein